MVLSVLKYTISSLSARFIQGTALTLLEIRAPHSGVSTGTGERKVGLCPTLQGCGWVVEGAVGDAAVHPSLLTGSCKGVPSEANSTAQTTALETFTLAGGSDSDQ